MDGACLADYDIASDGGLTLRGRFGQMKSPDGICLDREGAAWVAAFMDDAFIRFDRRGNQLQRIEVPAAGRSLRARPPRAADALLPQRRDVV
jgi:sugar lactone lactonase YvrE